MDALRSALDALSGEPWVDTALGLSILLVLALLSDAIARRVLLRVVRAAIERSEWTWDDALERSGTFSRLARVAPTLVVQTGVPFVPGLPEAFVVFAKNAAMAGTAFFLTLSLGAGLAAAQAMPAAQPRPGSAPIKGYLQLLKIVVYLLGAIVVVSTLLDRSPWLLLSGLTALSAVLLLVFKDTLLGLVASLQIGSNDMLRIGDWIEMPSAGADGDVIDIGLHTVKVRNWDRTITTIPTWLLISASFKNWRGMFEGGGRRIKRALWIDASTVRFLDDREVAAMRRFRLLDPYLDRKRGEIAEWNAALGDPGKVPVNQRRLTNLGTFRAYALAYLEAHPEIHPNLTRLVRQLATEGEGIPIELYCFTSTTAWVEYERIQADIFDHLIAILPEFGLGLYQRPAGSDLRRALPSADRPPDPAGRGPAQKVPAPATTA